MCTANETRSCADDEWCTGPATVDSAISFSGTETFCTKGNIKHFLQAIGI